MEDVVGEKWLRSRAITPEHWRHVRIIEADKRTFSIVGYATYSRFGPMAMLALGEDVNTPTQQISRAAALALGERLEKAFKGSNEPARNKRKNQPSK